MHSRVSFGFMIIGLSVLLAFDANGQGREDLSRLKSGKNGAVATGSREATDAALAMLKSGGNAVDAAVTSLLVQTVVESHLYCFGGEVPIIVYDAERDVVEVIVGLGAAPRLATPEWFNENREGLIQGRGDSANAVVPGTLDACITALDRFGTQTFAACATAMIEILEVRAKVTPENISDRIQDKEGWIKKHVDFLRMVRRLVNAEEKAGDDRKRGLRHVREYFYRGPIAHEIDAWSRETGGLLRYTDFAQHHTRIDEPLSIEYLGHTIHKCGVWTQGPFLLQTLRLLENLGIEDMAVESADYIHVVTEAMKLAFADRDAFYGDPDFVDVPIDILLSDEYTEIRAPLIDLGVASMTQDPGNPFKMEPFLGKSPKDYDVVGSFGNDTTNCLVADKFGNVVAATPSGWGGVIAGDTGVELGSRMIGLNVWDNHPSIVAPGKRPRITLTPTLVMKDGKPVFAVSVAGGDQQDQASIQILLNRLLSEENTEDSVRRPRFSTEHQINWFGHLNAKLGSLGIPRGIDESVYLELESRGHVMSRTRTAGGAVVLSINPSTGEKQAAGDFRRSTAAY